MSNRFIYNAGVEAIAKRARVAKTNEELASICKQLNVADEIFLGRVDLWLAKHALSTVYRTLKKYPALREDIHYFGTLNGFIKKKEALFQKKNEEAACVIADMFKQQSNELAMDCLSSFKKDGLAVAFFIESGRWGLSGIIINGKSMNQQSILRDLEIGEMVGHSPKGCKSIKSIVEHEIGHLLDYKLGISNSDEFNQIMRSYSTAYVYNNLSHYAAMNNVVDVREVVAEAYSEYCNNPAPREIALKVGRIIEKKYRDAFPSY